MRVEFGASEGGFGFGRGYRHWKALVHPYLSRDVPGWLLPPWKTSVEPEGELTWTRGVARVTVKGIKKVHLSVLGEVQLHRARHVDGRLVTTSIAA